jgi:hypothetical protein
VEYFYPEENNNQYYWDYLAMRHLLKVAVSLAVAGAIVLPAGQAEAGVTYGEFKQRIIVAGQESFRAAGYDVLAEDLPDSKMAAFISVKLMDSYVQNGVKLCGVLAARDQVITKAELTELSKTGFEKALVDAIKNMPNNPVLDHLNVAAISTGSAYAGAKISCPDRFP